MPLITGEGQPCAAGTTSQWPQFRGPGGSGVAIASDPPVVFGPSSNVLWRTPVPAGHSSPCIWDNRIFLTGFENNRLTTLCLDRLNGAILWRREVEPGLRERSSSLGHPAASTPATDGHAAYVYFGPYGLISYDFDGHENWKKPMTTPVTQHGAGTSPIVVDGRLLLNFDQDIGGYLLAVETSTGEAVWKADRSAYRRGFSTPLIWPPEKPELVIVPGTLRLTAYSLANGSERWSVSGLPNEMVTTPVTGGGLIFAAGWSHGAGVSKLPLFATLLEQGDRNGDGKLTREEAPAGPAKQHFLYIDADKDGQATREEWESIARVFEHSQNNLLAVRPDGRGEVTDTHVVWRQKRGLPYVPSPLYYEGRVYLVKNGGLASCFEAATGTVYYQEERLGALGDYYSSPVAANGRIYVASQPGVLVVYRAGEAFEVLARNPLGERLMATPAIVENKLYVRTEKHLYAFGE
ncbi:MAG: PQQ-binding-like beta-propeller repeat protein [Verrucomicrobia bacterium]|nr:PQQ-binding-like beta-propeller repeat protein [Verrucomicrobiota bacterium]